jgi:hypothetical protein
VKTVTPILAFYFLVLFPTINLFFSPNKIIYELWGTLYFALTLLLVLILKQVSLRQLGFNNIWKALAVGFLLGIIPLISVPLLDIWLIKSGLSQSELFMGAGLRSPQEIKFDMSLSGNILTVTIITFLDQVFVVGLVINNLLKKQKTGESIIFGGLLYSLIDLKVSVSNFALGMISTGLLRTTGSIITSIMVNLGFAVAGILIIFNYPRLISILVFLK